MRTKVLAACVGLLGMAGLMAPLSAEEETGPAAAEAVATEAEEEYPESAVSSPPMEMDDPGTPGKQGVEVNFVGTLSRAGEGRGTESLLDANLGIGDRIQLKYERPYVTEGTVGEDHQGGLGATEVGVKWRFVDQKGWQLAVYPQYEFDDAFTIVDAEGNPEESDGGSAFLPLLVSKQLGRAYTVGANVGYRRFKDHELDDQIYALGFGRALREGRVLAEVFSERDRHFENRQTDVRLGVAYLLFTQRWGNSLMEFPAYASLGHSVGRTEVGEAVTSFTFGISVIKAPKGE